MDRRNSSPKSVPQQIRAAATLADSGAPQQRPQAPVDRASATLADSGSSSATPNASATNGLADLRFHCRIGGGAMGEVSLFFDAALERWVAVKRIRPEHATGRGLDRFLSEARAMAKLRHPGIVQVFGIAQSGAESRILMEYVQGPTGTRPVPRPEQWPDNPPPPLSLEDLVRHQGPLPARQAIGIVAALCDAVDYTHRQSPPIYHRDIKPANVLLDENWSPKLADFGVAAIQPVSGGPSGTLVGTALGTPGYAAPEQRANAAGVDGRADVFSLGATLWNLLTAQPPEHFRVDQLQPALARALSGAMHPDPARRTQSAAALGAELRTVDARPVPWRKVAAVLIPLVLIGSALLLTSASDRSAPNVPAKGTPQPALAEQLLPKVSKPRDERPDPAVAALEGANNAVRLVLESARKARGFADDMSACDAQLSAFGAARTNDSVTVQAGRRKAEDAANGFIANMRAAKEELKTNMATLASLPPDARNAAIETALRAHADAVADSLYRRWLLNPILKDSVWESKFEAFWESDVLNMPAGGWSCRPKEIP